MKSQPLALVQGTLDMVVLRALAFGPMHGYGVASLVRGRTNDQLVIEDGALYQALHRLERQGLIEAEWGPSENNRRARYYTLTQKGRKRLREEVSNWQRYARAVSSLLGDA
jgi:PadR family transcriptional regulator PadR